MELNNEIEKLTPRTMLGRRLRCMREDAELSVRSLAEQVGYPYSYLSRVERGEQLPSEALASALDDRFETSGLFLDLLEIARDSPVPDYGRAILSKEGKATRIQVFTSSLIPGLLQTKDYAWNLFHRSLPGASEERLSELVDFRMRRKRIFDSPQPPYYWAIVDEASLKRPIGGAETMVEQLNYLVQIASRSYYTIQILPFTEGGYPMLGGCLSLLTLRDGKTSAFVESFASGESVDSPKRVVELTQRFDIARAMALSDSKSLGLIGTYLKGYEDEYSS